MTIKSIILGATLALMTGPTWASTVLSSVPDFDLDADVATLQRFFSQEDERPMAARQYHADDEGDVRGRRYVCFDMSNSKNEIAAALVPVVDPQEGQPFGRRTYHDRTDEIIDQRGVGPAVLSGLLTDGAQLFVRSSARAFEASYWATFELLVPVVPQAVSEEEGDVIVAPNGEPLNLSDLPSLHDEVGENVFTRHFFAMYYRQTVESDPSVSTED